MQHDDMHAPFGRFKDRQHAGSLLAQKLHAYAGHRDVIVVALSRGGVPVGFALAKALHVPLDVMVVRKLGAPGHAEYAIGALASGGQRVLQDEIIQALHISPHMIAAMTKQEMVIIEAREKAYRAVRHALPLTGRTVILVDDGLATGTTMRVAIQKVRMSSPARLIVAVPVSARETRNALAPLVDELICLRTPEHFYAVGLWYEDFAQTSDEEVCNLLRQSQKRPFSPLP